MNRTISIGSIVALFAVAIASSMSVFSTASTPAKIAMFALGIMAGILIGRLVTQRAATGSQE